MNEARNDGGRPPGQPLAKRHLSPLRSVSLPLDFTRARLALAAVVQGREALADGDVYFAEASLENAEVELVSFLQQVA